MGSVVLQCKYKSDFVPITLDDRYLFVDLVRIVCDRFNLNSDSISLSYVVRDVQKCLLRSEDELRDMRSLVSALGIRLVDVTVSDSSLAIQCSDLSVVSSVVVDEIENCEVESSTTSKVYLSTGWINCITGVGQVFSGGVSEFRRSLRKYSIECGREILFVKNESKKVYARCPGMTEHDCGWLIKATMNVVDKSFVVREFVAEHCCPLPEIYDANKLLNCKLVAELIQGLLRDDPSMGASAVVSRLKNDYGYHISYYKAWMAVQTANKTNMGDPEQSYMHLEGYLQAVKQTNPGSHIVLETDTEDTVSRRFKRLFLSFDACIQGFTHVRPMLFIDGTFLKGKYKGTLLSAVAKNGNRGLYPIAFGVVDSENKDNWDWFLRELRTIIGTDRRLLFFSDRHIGLLDAMSTVFPDSVHCYCLRHLKDNLKKRFGGCGVKDELIQLLEDCATAPTICLFEKSMKKLISVGGPKMKDFIDELPFEKWTTAYAVGTRYGETTSNAVESFNNWILDIRELPITEMIDHLRIKLMKWYDLRRTQSAAWKTPFCSIYQTRWKTSVHNSRSWDIQKSSGRKFEVFSKTTHCVDLNMRECTCFKWQIEGFPCIHAVLCIISKKLRLNDYVEKYFFSEAYQKSYEMPIQPVPSCLWRDSGVQSNSVLLPPNTKRQPVRPKTKRIPSRGEVVSAKRRMIICSRCKQYGNHNSRTCKAAISGGNLCI